MTDMPYEKVVISQSMIEPNKIVAWDFFGGEDNIILMAKYSTPEKAEKVMQMLHECYTGMLYMRNADFGKDVDVKERLKESMRQGIGFITVFDTEENVKIEPMNIVFRFPQEDEV